MGATERPPGHAEKKGAEARRPTGRRQAVQRHEVRVHLQQLRQQQREGREEDQAQGPRRRDRLQTKGRRRRIPSRLHEAGEEWFESDIRYHIE